MAYIYFEKSQNIELISRNNKEFEMKFKITEEKQENGIIQTFILIKTSEAIKILVDIKTAKLLDIILHKKL